MPRDQIHNLDPSKYRIYLHTESLLQTNPFTFIHSSVFSPPYQSPRRVLCWNSEIQGPGFNLRHNESCDGVTSPIMVEASGAADDTNGDLGDQ